VTAFRVQPQVRQLAGFVRTLQQHRQAQQRGEAPGGRRQPVRDQFEGRLRHLAPVRAHQRGEHALLRDRESGDVRMLQHVGAVHLVLAVRDRQAEFVQARGAHQHPAIVGAELPVAADAIEQLRGGRGDALGLGRVDAVALHQRQHRGVAGIVGAATAEHVMQHALAQRGLAHAHAFQAERRERGFQHQQAAGDDRAPLLGQAGQVDRVDASRAQQPFAHLRQRFRRHRALGQLEFRADVADGLDRARRAERLLPAEVAVDAGELLELRADFEQRLVPALRGQLAVAEEARGRGHAAELQALALDRVEAGADDAFGRTAADVDHQAQLAGLRRLRLGDAKVDQARLLATGDHFDGVAERGFRRHQEGLRRLQRAHGVGRHRAYPLRRDVAQPLAEAGEAFERPRAHLGPEPALAVEPLGEPHHLAEAVDRAQLAEHVARDHHVEAVGAQVDRREQVAILHRQGGGARSHVRMPGVVHAPSISASRLAWAECGTSPATGRRRR
jgi:hypothetical protein